MFSLNEIIAALGGPVRSGRSLLFSEAVIDSRQLINGTLFVALTGEKTDGHSYVTEAFRKGALAALVSRPIDGTRALDLRSGSAIPEDQGPEAPFCILVEDPLLALQKIAAWHRSQLKLTVIGITGTVGKSTTKELICEVASRSFMTLKNSGNLNNEIGLPLTLLRAGKGHEAAVLEMGFYVPGEIQLLCDIARPQIGVLTNVGTVHAERAGSIENIARGKSELVAELPADGVAILNYDDPYVLPMRGVTKAAVLTYGLDNRADLWADEIESFGLDGIRFRLHSGSETFQIRVPLIGRHSVHTALRAIAVGRALKMRWEEIFRGLDNSQSQLRMSVMMSREGAMIIDDTYNASPDSVIAALDLLDEIHNEKATNAKKIAILGDMRELGQYEIQGHRAVGQRAAQSCDELIAVGRSAREIVFAAVNAGMKPEKIKWFATVAETIEYVELRKFAEGETVLVKGSRSLQMEQIIAIMES